MIEVDGSYGEGGGQILRTAVALSALTRKSARIVNIRANRPNPGLSHQHIAAVRCVAEMSNATVQGLGLSSRSLEFFPGELEGGSYEFDVGTAGSVSLVLQACLLPALSAGARTKVTIRGGTDVRWSPPADYLLHVFIPMLGRMGAKVHLDVIKRGYYPRGGGEVRVVVEPAGSLGSLNLSERGRVLRIRGIAHASNLPEHIPRRIRDGALSKLMSEVEAHIEALSLGEKEAFGQGGAIVLWAEAENTILGASSLAEKGVPAERVGESAALVLEEEVKSGATVDVHLADQLLPYMAVADGPSSFLVRELSLHSTTSIWLIKKFLAVEFQRSSKDGLESVGVLPGRDPSTIH